MPRPLAAALLVLVLAPHAAAGDRAPLDLVRVRLATPHEHALLERAASDLLDHGPRRRGERWILADDAEQARLARLGLELEVEVEDLGAAYRERAAGGGPGVPVGGPGAPVGGSGAGSMGGFRTLDEIVAELDRLSTTYPDLVGPRFAYGTSLEGRTLWALRVGDDPTVPDPLEPKVWLDALHHSREPMSAESLLRLVDWLASRYAFDPRARRILDSREIVVLPCVNPDGYEHNRLTNPGGGGFWRKNRRDNGDGTFGVDLNRNYGWEWGPQWNGSSGTTSSETYRGAAPFSEPETAALRDLLALERPALSISVHCYGQYWIVPWGYADVPTPDARRFEELGQAMLPGPGWVLGNPVETVGYGANGSSADWHYGQEDVWAFSPELGGSGDGFWPAPERIDDLFAEVLPAYLAACELAGARVALAGVEVLEVLGDGDGTLEPGETGEVRPVLANDGVAPAHGGLRLVSLAPEVTVRHAWASFDLAPGTTAMATPAGPYVPATMQPAPLWVEVAPGAAPGRYDLRLEVTYEGATNDELLALRVGHERVLALDTMEDGDLGWEAASDGANYAFERADPQGTTSDGAAVQPEDDHTPAGTHAWVTGAAAGAGVGANDVDGTTTLVSPAFRTAGLADLRLEVALWFANRLGNELDDLLRLEASGDDGQSWVIVEEAGDTGGWEVAAFDLGEHVPLGGALRLRFTASDDPNNDLTEAAVDDLRLTTLALLPTLGHWGPSAPGAAARLFVDGPPGVAWKVLASPTAGAGVPDAAADGTSYLTGTPSVVQQGVTDADGRAALDWTVPAGSGVHLQALFDEGGPQAAWSNLVTVGAP